MINDTCMATHTWKSRLKNLFCAIIPLLIRKHMAIYIGRQKWLGSSKTGWWAKQLIADCAKTDINAYHKFLWQNHLDYAESYEIDLRFGYDNFNETRKIFFAELPSRLAAVGLNAKQDIKSIFEVGCSSGYLLRYLETDIFPAADRVHGNDIDAYAIKAGNDYLQKTGSRIELYQSDMEQLDKLLAGKQYDFMLAAGILLYLDEQAAARLIQLMLQHTKEVLAITALAYPHADNSELKYSKPRKRDKTWIHNVDQMVKQAGGTVIARRWEGSKVVDGNTVYFIYAVPA